MQTWLVRTYCVKKQRRHKSEDNIHWKNQYPMKTPICRHCERRLTEWTTNIKDILQGYIVRTSHTQTLTYQELCTLFDKKRNKVDIMMDALDYMQQHNGRTKIDCIALALGYEDIEGDNDYFTRVE